MTNIILSPAARLQVLEELLKDTDDEGNKIVPLITKEIAMRILNQAEKRLAELERELND